MPDETQDKPHPLETRVSVLERDMDVVRKDVHDLRDKIDKNGRDTTEHLSRQDIETSEIKNQVSEIKVAIVGKINDNQNIGIVRKMDGMATDLKALKSRFALWGSAFWFVVGAVITAVLGGIAFAVASYIIHR